MASVFGCRCRIKKKTKKKRKTRKITHRNFCSTCINVLSSWNDPPRDGIVWSGEWNLQGGSCCFHTLRRIKKKKKLSSFFFFFFPNPAKPSQRPSGPKIGFSHSWKRAKDLPWIVCQRLSLKKNPLSFLPLLSNQPLFFFFLFFLNTLWIQSHSASCLCVLNSSTAKNKAEKKSN